VFVERTELVLIGFHSMIMHPNDIPSASGISPPKGVAKKRIPIAEVGLVWLVPGHPIDIPGIVLVEVESSEELMHMLDAIIMVELHDRVEPKLLSDPNPLVEIGLFMQLLEIQSVHGAHLGIVGQIDLLVHLFLLS
jgi:hypothetical protein